MDDQDIAQEATDIANHVQAYLAGRSSAASLYGLGMVLAAFVSWGKDRDVDGVLVPLRKVIDAELKRQFSN